MEINACWPNATATIVASPDTLMGSLEEEIVDDSNEATLEIDGSEQAPCDHDLYAHYKPYAKATKCFTEAHLGNNPLFPKQCDGCKKKFVDKTKNIDPETEYKVTSKAVVFLCPNGCNTHHNCMHALCGPCYDPKLQGTQKKRMRKEKPPYTPTKKVRGNI